MHFSQATAFPCCLRPTASRSVDVGARAFSGKVDTDLGFTRDRHSMSPKSAEADLGGFPQKMRPLKEARARFRFNLIETRSSRKPAKLKRRRHVVNGTGRSHRGPTCFIGFRQQPVRR